MSKTKKKNELHVLVAGDPIDGITIYGPFESNDEAVELATAEIGSDWWVVKLESPDLLLA